MDERELRSAIVAAAAEVGIRANDPGAPSAIGMALPWFDDVLGASVDTRISDQTVSVQVFSITAYGPRPAESPHLPELVELLQDLTSGIAEFHYLLNPVLGVPAASLDVVFDDEATTDGISAEVVSVLTEMFEDYGARMPTFAGILEGYGTGGGSQS
jgi:hypothetical protein